MKKIIFSFLLTLLASAALRALDASLSYATFKNGSGGFIEVYLHVIGKTVEFQPTLDSNLQASVEVVILFKKAGTIIKFDKYRLNSPLAKSPMNFVDVKRYALENGDYEIEVSLQDLNRADNAGKYAVAFNMDFSDDRLGQSDIQLLASFKKADPGMEKHPMVKSGLYLEALPANFCGKNASLLTFYNEIYGADRFIGADYMVSYFIEKTDAVGEPKIISIAHKRRSPEPVAVLLHQMDISQLESGNFNLTVEVRSSTKQLLSKKSVFFQRSNPNLTADREDIAAQGLSGDEFVTAMNEDELRFSLKAIAMQVDKTDGELMNILIKEKKQDAMRLYLFSYWAKQNPNNPKVAYDAYMEVAKAIDRKFENGFGYGFETDRGNIFMKYGAPNDVISVENDPSAPPYEIWFYNQFPQTGQNNVKFLFYNPSLADNGFLLLHSNARGEINNPRWEIELYRNAPTESEDSDFIGGTRMQDNVGRHARRLFEGN